MEDLHIEPQTVTLPFFGGIEVLETLVNAVAVSIVIILIAAIIRIFYVPKFKEVPSRFQLILELAVDAISDYTKSKVGTWVSKTLSPYMFTIAVFIMFNGILELMGFRAAMADINFTVAISLITFILIQVYAIRKKGIIKRLKSFTEPTPILTPVNIVTSLSIPISLSCRMFGNILGGMIVMELLYSVALLKWGVAGVLSIYFTVFHTLMQAFIFITLSLTFIHEGLEGAGDEEEDI